VSVMPSASIVLSVSANPSVSTVPSISAMPSQSIIPSVSEYSPVSANPLLSDMPSMSAIPSVSVNPSLSAMSSLSAIPSVSANPSLSIMPSMSVMPSLSTDLIDIEDETIDAEILDSMAVSQDHFRHALGVSSNPSSLRETVFKEVEFSFLAVQIDKFTGADLTEICQSACKLAIREEIGRYIEHQRMTDEAGEEMEDDEDDEEEILSKHFEHAVVRNARRSASDIEILLNTHLLHRPCTHLISITCTSRT